MIAGNILRHEVARSFLYSRLGRRRDPEAMKKRILVAEDDRALARVLRDNLASQGFVVDWVDGGDLVEDRARDFAPDLVILDVMLPGKSGFDLVPSLKERSRTAVVLLTARSQRADILKGLYLGADDYITKPFNLGEFLARVRAVLRRSAPSGESLVMGNVTINFLSRTARWGKTESVSDAPRVRVTAVPLRTPGSHRASRRVASRGVGLPGEAAYPFGRQRHSASPQERSSPTCTIPATFIPSSAMATP